MKIYIVTVQRGNEFKTTYCDYRPEQNEKFNINGEIWFAASWI